MIDVTGSQTIGLYIAELWNVLQVPDFGNVTWSRQESRGCRI
jgi:hypothetical protein